MMGVGCYRVPDDGGRFYRVPDGRVGCYRVSDGGGGLLQGA